MILLSFEKIKDPVETNPILTDNDGNFALYVLLEEEIVHELWKEH